MAKPRASLMPRTRDGYSSFSTTTIDPDPLTVIGKRTVPMGDGCLAYNGDLDHYGVFRSGAVHRFVYEAIHGPAHGFHIHHTCRNPGCISPAHLVRLTPAEHRREHLD